MFSVSHVSGRDVQQLVANRECGKCTVCCKVPAIDHPDLQKLPGVTCPNCKVGGCRIYETRPDPCRKFYCGWRYLPGLGNEWRPDKLGILIRFEQAPPGYASTAFQFLVFGGGDVVRPIFIDYMMQMMARGFAVFLAVRGPEGFSDAKLLLNEHLAEAVARRDRSAVVKFVREALASLSTHKFEPAVLAHAPPPPTA
jgi:hypothetical protein